jgi:hypothetical protein
MFVGLQPLKFIQQSADLTTLCSNGLLFIGASLKQDI